MRKLFLLALLLTAFFIWLNRNESQKPVAPAKPQSVSEHDWAKRSIDRARAVSDQARKNQVESQKP